MIANDRSLVLQKINPGGKPLANYKNIKARDTF